MTTDDPMPGDVIALRRDLHGHPESGFAEFRTASRVAAALHAAGWQLALGTHAMDPAACLRRPPPDDLASEFDLAAATGGVADFLGPMRGGMTAIVATLRGRRVGPVVAFRFDMDALPITESADLASHRPTAGGYRSRRDGMMHACGHDAHVAIGVALARRLADRDFPGTVRLLFQPAEEGGRGGAAAMAAAGAVTNVDLLICPHIGLGLPTGAVAVAVDGLLANSKLRIRFTGRSAHAAAAPQNGRHALLGAAVATLNIHALGPFAGHDTRVNVGMLRGGTASNVIPDNAEILAETRADDTHVNAELESRVRAVVGGAADMHGLTAQVDLVGSVPSSGCSAVAAQALATAAKQVGLEAHESHYMGASDDAAVLMRAVVDDGGAATYCVIGADLAGPHHHPAFDFDETALPAATALLEDVVRNRDDSRPLSTRAEDGKDAI